MAQQEHEPIPADGRRTAHEWLIDFGWELVDATEQDQADLNRIMDHDEFWEWSGGKVKIPCPGNTTWRQAARDLTILVVWFGGLLVCLAVAQWVISR